MHDEHWRQAVLALGANLGDRLQNLEVAVAALSSSMDVRDVVRSAIYESAPVGYTQQPDFLNMVVGVSTRLSPEQLLELTSSIESRMGRRRSFVNAPRPIDIDLLFYAHETRSTPSLTLPHPRWAERSFVTLPLAELLHFPCYIGSYWGAVRSQVADATPGPALRLYHAPPQGTASRSP